MKSYTSSTLTAASLALLVNIATACNPYLTSGCISTNPALGKTTTIDFTQESSDFSSTGGAVNYTSNGALLSVTGSGVAPTLISNWYIMFGKFEIVMQVAPGAGLVSSAILQSDDLDEIDWEILGSTPSVAQTNYFGKGLTTSYDREGDVAAANNPPTFHTYTIDWNAERIIWSVDGNAERTLTAANADPGQYPQTPMQIKIGPWAGGDQSNSALGAGTIAWATANSGQYTNWAAGPFNMYVKSVTVEDYSTGTDYTYGGAAFQKSGDYTLVTAQGGSVNSGATSGAAGSGSSSPASSSPVSSSIASGQSSLSTATRYTNTTTVPKATANPAALSASESSLRSAVAASASAATGIPAAGAVTGAVTEVTLVTTAVADPNMASSTITKVIAASAASGSVGGSGTTTKASASATSSGVVLQTGNAAARVGMGQAAAVLGVAAGVVAYVL